MIDIQCMYCKNLKEKVVIMDKWDVKFRCKAFNEIPEEYLKGKLHDKSDGKDNGIVFEPNIDKKGLINPVKIPILILRDS